MGFIEFAMWLEGRGSRWAKVVRYSPWGLLEAGVEWLLRPVTRRIGY